MAYGSSKIGAYEPIKRKTNTKNTKNDGGLLGGAGYLATSAAAGLAGGAEGIIDIGTALVADLTGNHDYAEYVFKDNVVGDWHESVTEDFNPGTGWQFAGDVAHGLGQSSWFLLSLIPGAQWLGPAVFGAGMIGQGISGAAETTGDVGVKEVAYGVTTAAVETGLETLMGGTGKAVKAIAGAGAKKLGKEAIFSLVKTAGRKGVAKQILYSAGSEFLEEFTSELIDTALQRGYQIDPNKEYSLRDALYSGLVGMASGAISATPGSVINASVNQRNGAKIIKKGNSQTLVNTATKLADQLAASGTNFKNAPEWVKTLRGEVDAYNALVKKGQSESLSAQTILGEMQASIAFAQTQAINSHIRQGIMEASEDDRAALAEYINQSFDKSQRKKDYTAEDIANNTDDIATQLAILKYVKIFDINGAVAEAEINAKIADEQRKAMARAEQKSAENAPAMANEAAQSVENAPAMADEAAQSVESVPAMANEVAQRVESGVQKAPVNGNIQAAQVKGAPEPVSVDSAIETDEVKADLDDTKYSISTAKASKAKIKANEERASRNAAKKAQEAREIAEGTEAQKTVETNAEEKGEGKAAEKVQSAESGVQSEEKSSESKKSESKSGEPKVSEAKETLTDEQRKEKARKRAEQMIEWEKNNAPTVKELNTAREYVKSFDNLSQGRKASIVRMIRSADGKVDAKIIKGVSNLIAAMPRADVEIRFAEGLGGDLGGFYAPKVGGKALIVIDSSTNFKKTIQGTIAHELVHHLEKNAGYKEFAKFVMSRVKPEKKAEVEKRYTDFHTEKYTAEAKRQGMNEAEAAAYVKEKISSDNFKKLVESEIVAKYTGEALNNEKLLKKYADKDKKFIAKVGEWLWEKVKTLRKNKDKATAEEQESYKETIKVAEEMAAMVAALAQETDVVGESKGGVKYSVAGAENEESNSIKDQLKKSNDKLASMTPIKSKETPRTFKNAKEALEWAVEVLKSSGEVIQRKGYGEVVLDEKRLKNGLAYLKTDMEKVAFSLVPKVIKNGIEIGRHPKHKDRIYDTVTFASPVTVGDTTGYMAVVIREEGKNYFKLHRVFMPDGSLFEFQETKRSNAETAGLRNANLSPTNVTSINSIHQNEPIVNSSAKKDAEYLSAVERGDMETAQKMVDEAAKKAGYTVKAYHGTDNEFTVFDKTKIMSNMGAAFYGTGFYFSTSERDANNYGNKIMPVYLRVGKTLDLDSSTWTYDLGIEQKKSKVEVEKTHIEQAPKGFINLHYTTKDAPNIWKSISNVSPVQLTDDETGKKFVEKKLNPESSILPRDIKNLSELARNNGYNSIKGSGTNIGDIGVEYVLFDEENIKSADPVTYDDNGKVIPLSQRFNEAEDDIRYDLAEEETEAPKKKAKTKAEVIAENRELKAENKELKESKNQMRGMLEKLNRERAELSKAENAEVFDKSDVELAVKSIESWTEEEALSLAKGNVELNKMGKAKREEMISQIYIALHEQGAVGRTGPGSIAVKSLAAKIAGEYIDSAAVMGEDGKLYHLADIYDEVTMGKLKQELTNLLYGEFAHMGKSTGVNELVARMRAQKQAFRQERFNDATIAKAAKDVAYQAHELRKLAEQQKREGATESIQLVTKRMAQAADAKGNVSVKLLDTAIGEASRFLSGEAFKSESISGEEAKKESILDFDAVVDGELKFKIDEYLRLREEHKHKTLTAEEMRLAGEILRKMKATIERYNKEYINGHYVEVDELVVSAVSDLISFAGKQKDYKNKFTKFLGEKLGKKANEWYFYQILSPETVIEAIEGYKQGGLLKSLYHSVRVAKQKAEHRAVQMKKPFAEFLDNKENAWEEEKDGKIRKHSYRNKLNKKIINVNGNEITLGEAIYLLMLTKREHAHRGLQESGYKCYSDDGQVTASFKVLDIERTRDLIYNQLDKTDLEFLKMAEEFFNVTSTKVKQDADYLIFGYTNTQDTYYVPIIRDRYSRMNGVTDARQSIGSIITVYNKSFNQNIVQNAKALEGKSIMRIINDHADGLADYAEMYLPLKAFDRVYNRGVIGADGKTTTIREVVGTKVWNGAEGYFKELFQDVQGQSRQNDSTMLNRAVGFMRSAWVNSVLGANIKVVATQTTSLCAATQIIEPKYITAALSVIGKRDLSELRTRAYEYSDIIEARNFDMGALKAQGNIDKVGKIGEKTGFLIGWMDERICFAIFHAAELKVEAQGGGAVGTEANAVAAAKIADEAIYTTQAMSSASERSALQRSPNEIAKVFSMFTSDSVKNLSHFYGNIMKFIAHSERVKAGDASYEALLENDKKEILRSARTIAITGIMLGVITQAFKYLYAKEEEEPEDKLKDFGLDIVSSTLNILPGVSDVIDKFVFNYDMSVNVLDVANDTIETFGKGAKLAGKSMNGEFVSTQDVASVMIDIIKSTLSFGGIPISPVERTVTGLLRRFAPSAIYGYDAMFYNPSYTSDLKAAVESGDDALAEHVLSTLYKNEVTGVYTSDELGEVVRLYGLTDEEGKHYNVLPQKIGTEINGVKLTSAQRKRFTSIYSGASGKVNEFIDSSYYQTLTDEQRAKAIKNIYALYYNRAAAEVAGETWTNAQAYSQLTSNYSALFAAQAYKSGLKAYKDDAGREVTVKEQLEAYMQNLGLSDSDYLVIAYALGYKSKDNKAAILAYINSLSLTPEAKAQIAERLGFEIKDGVVVEKEE